MELDLDWCYYLATNVLGMSEEEFLKSTPRKLFALADIHKKMNSSEKEKEEEEDKEIYIDELVF